MGDGMAAHLATPIRHAGFETLIFEQPVGTIQMFRNSMRPFQPQQDDGSYPPDTEYNHVSNTLAGPTREDFAVACPTDASKLQQERRCVSLQETIWGRAALARLDFI